MTDGEQETEHNRLYRQASAIVFPLIEIHGQPVPKLTPTQESELQRGITLFDQVVRINPQNWAAMWMVGKAYQRMRVYDYALAWFTSAHGVNPTHPDVAREAAIAAMELGRLTDAITFCERAIKAEPDDPGLRANLALATLFSGNPQAADTIIRDAVRRDPTDRISERIAEVCRAVLAGERTCPRHTRDIM